MTAEDAFTIFIIVAAIYYVFLHNPKPKYKIKRCVLRAKPKDNVKIPNNKGEIVAELTPVASKIVIDGEYFAADGSKVLDVVDFPDGAIKLVPSDGSPDIIVKRSEIESGQPVVVMEDPDMGVLVIKYNAADCSMITGMVQDKSNLDKLMWQMSAYKNTCNGKAWVPPAQPLAYEGFY
jgi:hypothetical protein